MTIAIHLTALKGSSYLAADLYIAHFSEILSRLLSFSMIPS